jgi:tetratricopeptide (TPR) repeat protein
MWMIYSTLLVSTLATWGVAEESPYQRLLQGDDAKKAASLEKRIKELWAAGKFAEAVPPAEEVRALRRRVQGEGHWQVADAVRQAETLRKVAALPAPKQAALAEGLGTSAKAEESYKRGKYDEAEPLYRRAVAVYEEVLGPRHAYVADSYNDLAFNLKRQGRVLEAELLSRKALAICEEVLGPRDPPTRLLATTT